MIDDLFEVSEQSEYLSVSGNPLGVFDLFHRRVDEGLIERSLLARERTKYLVLHLFGQILDDLWVGFDASEDKRCDDVSESFFGFFVVIALNGHPIEPLESRMRAQEPRIEEVQDRPELGESVFDRRSREGDAEIGL